MGAGSGAVVSPMQGTVLSVAVADGEEVESGGVICVVEAMKMENEISATRPGRVKEVAVSEGQSVESGRLLVVVE